MITWETHNWQQQLKKSKSLTKRWKKDEWQQSIRVILGDIKLNNDTLIELLRFRPDETVNVSFKAVQMNLFDDNSPQEDELYSITEGDVPLREGDVVEKEFRF